MDREAFIKELESEAPNSEKESKLYARMSSEIIWALVSAVEAKDPYTEGHSGRVADYTRMMVQRLGVSAKAQKKIYFISLMHDIGKIGIPDYILNKTSGLTDEEFQLIKDHPVIGERILSGITSIPELAIGARWHHEKYDGTGYPDGLKGEEIPKIARLIAVADSYDAMASKRSYRDILPQAVIRSEIEKGIGTQFDPVFAGLMLEIIDEDKDYTLHG
ncbi:MAG: HD-GYP domain-containing protein [Eubacteriales bacterium]|nr:HD-GYP domain-containing protein [Eubacteriales bacterium]